MHPAARLVAKSAGRKAAVGGFQWAFAQFSNERLGAAAVLNQVGDGANFEAVDVGKLHKVGQAGHGAVVLHDFANHGRGRTTRHLSQVATRLGVASPHQHTTIYRL